MEAQNLSNVDPVFINYLDLGKHRIKKAAIILKVTDAAFTEL